MFQLIVAVISIALVAALAIASIFYGGDAFTKSSEKANVTTLVNQGQQISGAAQLYKTDTAALPATVKALVDGKYLQNNPTPSKIATQATDSWTIVGGYATVPFASGVTADAKGLLCATDGEVVKQNGRCATVSGSTVTEVNTNAATHFVFKL